MKDSELRKKLIRGLRIERPGEKDIIFLEFLGPQHITAWVLIGGYDGQKTGMPTEQLLGYLRKNEKGDA